MSPWARRRSTCMADGRALSGESGSSSRCCAVAPIATNISTPAITNRALTPILVLGRRTLRGLTGLVTGEKVLPLLTSWGEVARFDVAEAADVVRDRGDLERERLVLRVQARQQPRDGLLVLADQRALGAPLLHVAERLERAAARELEVRQHLEDGEHPGPETLLLLVSRERRRSEVVKRAIVALEHAFDLLAEVRVGVQPRDFVFILVRGQLR